MKNRLTSVALLLLASAAHAQLPPNDVGTPAAARLALPAVNGSVLGGVCPPAGTVTSAFSGTNSQNGRIFRDAMPSTCAGKPYPGIFNATTAYFYETFTYPNTSAAPACVTVNFDPDSAANPTPCATNAHASAYIGSYNPANQAANFIGDVGSSVAQPFLFQVPASTNLVLVVSNTSSAAACNFSFQVVNLPCSQAADLSLTLGVTPSSGAAGTPVAVSATATNAGPGAAQNAQIVIALPASLNLLSSTASAGGVCTAAGSPATVTCIWAGSTAAGAAISANLATTLAVGSGSVTASASSATTDPTPTNNSGSAAVSGTPPLPTFPPPSVVPALGLSSLLLLGVALLSVGVLVFRRRG
ncbi:DUF11 domain-containing protein [Aquimonas sp.]|jgi:hypothetical protein|uniref:DUF11 domain-containing protein n=1 Tax=Aquimonas sp. TaxID=1872588 RepID=UPI0037BF55AC